MKKIIIAAAATVFTAGLFFYPLVNAECQAGDCCKECRARYTACCEKYEKRLFSECHYICGKKYPGNKKKFSSCLDKCYSEADERIKSEGHGICDSRYSSCSYACGGCGAGD